MTPKMMKLIKARPSCVQKQNSIKFFVELIYKGQFIILTIEITVEQYKYKKAYGFATIRLLLMNHCEFSPVFRTFLQHPPNCLIINI
jgi:hypothetical protein